MSRPSYYVWLHTPRYGWEKHACDGEPGQPLSECLADLGVLASIAWLRSGYPVELQILSEGVAPGPDAEPAVAVTLAGPDGPARLERVYETGDAVLRAMAVEVLADTRLTPVEALRQ